MIFRIVLSFLFIAQLVALTTSQAQKIEIGPGEGDGPKIATFAVSPSILTLKIGDRPASGAVRLYNMSHQKVSISVSVHSWEMDDDNQVKVIPPTVKSISKWTIVNPVKFEVLPGKWQTVRISVRPRAKLDPGEHRAIVFFSEVPEEPRKKVGMKFYFRFGTAIYGLAGDIKREGVLHGIEMKKEAGAVNLEFDISSVGNANVRIFGQTALWPKEEYDPSAEPMIYKLKGSSRNVPEKVLLVTEIPRTPILQGTRRTLKTSIKLDHDPGEYILLVHGKLHDRPFKKTFPVTIEPLPQ